MIPFNKPVLSGNELNYIRQAVNQGQLAGDGTFTQRCEDLILKQTDGVSAHLTHSCTAALEMAAILCDLKLGDEVIMPSYTFVSTANAVVLRQAVPVFVDIEPETLNLNPALIEAAITEKTRAIWPIHYAGVIADMKPILDIAKRHNLRVVEDAAQALGTSQGGQKAGSFGDMAAFSFHETKNIISGEGGALVVNDPDLTLRAEIIREKGTNRRQFFRGMVDKYSWVDIGSSYLPGELVAAFLCAQLESSDRILQNRMTAWAHYHAAFKPYEEKGQCRRIRVPKNCEHNAHMYYLILGSVQERQDFIAHMKKNGIIAPFHYVPLHSSDQGKKCSRTYGSMSQTDKLSARLVRLPLFPDVFESQDKIITICQQWFDQS